MLAGERQGSRGPGLQVSTSHLLGSLSLSMLGKCFHGRWSVDDQGFSLAQASLWDRDTSLPATASADEAPKRGTTYCLT